MWVKLGVRYFDWETCRQPVRRDHDQKPLVDRLPGFCPAVHPLDFSQWTAALGPVAKRNKCRVTQAGTLAASFLSFHIESHKTSVNFEQQEAHYLSAPVSLHPVTGTLVRFATAA
jgi:hypothetical protein